MHENFLSPNKSEKFLSPNKSENFLSPKNTMLQLLLIFLSLENFTISLTILSIDCCSPTIFHLFSALSHIYTAHTAYILFFKFPLITHK